MNTNSIIPLQSTPKTDWKGLCIWNQEVSRTENVYCKFKKEFSAGISGTLKIDMSADTYFNLYIDGEFFARGPARGHLESYFYEHYEIFLEKGKHLIEVIVHTFGIECATHRKGKGCLLADCFFEEQNLSTDSTWQSGFLSGYKTSKEVLSHFGFQENVDLSELKNIHYTDALVLGDYSSASFVNLLPNRIKKFKYSYVNFENISSGKIILKKVYEDYFETVCKCSRKINEYNLKMPFTAEDHSFIVFGLSKTYSGSVILKIIGEKGQDIYVSFDDQLSVTGLVNPGRTYARYVDRYTLDNGENHIESILPRGFKYIMVDLPKGATLLNVSARAEEYPFKESAAFESSDAFLNQLYKQSVLTTKTCTIDGFTDCVTRERVLWMQDLYIDSLNVFYNLNDNEIIKQMMFMFAQGQQEDGRIITYAPSDITWCANPPGTFMWMNLLVDYINFTGDVQSVEKLLPTLKRLLEFIQAHTNDDGLIDSWYGSQFWDWSYNEQQGIMTITNAYYAYTLERMLACETLKDTVISVVKTSKAKIKKGLNEALKNEDGLYSEAILESGEKSNVVSQLANGVVMLSNIVGDEESAQLAKKITSKENLRDVSIGEISINELNRKKFDKIIPVGTMAGAMLVSQGFFEHGLAKEALQYIYDIWSPYHKAETIQEMRINGDNNTVCHGWSAAPAFMLPMYVLGLRPIAKGWEKAVLTPQLEALSHVKGEVNTPKGKLKVEISRNILILSVPKGIELEVNYLGKKLMLTECEELIFYVLEN